MRRTIVAALLLVVSGAGCRRPVAGVPVADTYDKVGRPEVWRVPAQCQAARLGMLPGDVVLAYAGDPVHSYEEMLAAEAAAGGGPVEVAVLRGEQELTLEGVSGPLGFVPNSVRYSGSLALALEAILASFGRPVDYGWLAALTSESFTLSGRAGECESWWPGGKDGTYLEEIGELMGLTLDRAFVNGGADTLARRQATVAAGLPAIRNGLGRGRALLVRGEWGESPVAFWGVASRLDDPDSAVLGYSIGSATEQRLTGDVMEVFV
ncbi:hypothetical protein FJY71_07755, partial [candidate division WOR-3 bacterium]|nr:hypothetical protein [candidate division WOR-3 bacterium]